MLKIAPESLMKAYLGPDFKKGKLSNDMSRCNNSFFTTEFCNREVI